jgi:hypothetical protein
MFEFTLNSLPQFGQGHLNAVEGISKKKKNWGKDLTRSAGVRIYMDAQTAWTIEAFKTGRANMFLPSTLSRIIVVAHIIRLSVL